MDASPSPAAGTGPGGNHLLSGICRRDGAVNRIERNVGMAPRSRAGGVLVLMLVPVVLVLLVLPAMPGGRTGAAATVLGLVGMWVTAALAVRVARRPPPLRLGLGRPARLDLLVALGAGVCLMLAVPALSVVGTLLMPAQKGYELVGGAHWPVVLAGVVTAAVTEEIVFRGAGITALEAAGARTWVAAGICLVLFVLTHSGGWPLSHVLFVVLPFGLALTGLFVWRRSLWVVMLAHLLVDLPLVALAL